MINSTEDINNLIEQAKQSFSKQYELDRQGHKHVKEGITVCFSISKMIDDKTLENVLIEKELIKQGQYKEKNKAKYILWLTMGKPNKNKKSSDTDRKIYEQQSARLRMYMRVLKKFISLDLEVEEAENFLEKYGVYAIANLKKIDELYPKDTQSQGNGKEENNKYEDDDEEDDEDDEDDDYEEFDYKKEDIDDNEKSKFKEIGFNDNDDNHDKLTKKQQKQKDKLESFCCLKEILSSAKFHYERIVIIKNDDGNIIVCRKEEGINSLLKWLSNKKKAIKTSTIDKIIKKFSDDCGEN